jgi:hypothetical protein
VRLFGRHEEPVGPPIADGIATTATIDRIAVTGITRYDRESGLHPTQVWITFSYVAQDGTEVVREQDHWLRSGCAPRVGSRARIVYHPGSFIEFSHTEVEPPDPAVPAGWSAGVFSVPYLGGHLEMPPDVRASLDAERELFKTGIRGQATVLATKAGWMSNHESNEVTFTLRTGDQEFTAARWLASAYYPEIGDAIEIAVSPDGTQVALDTDERYTGGKGRALVFRTPAAEQAKRDDLARRAAGPATDDLLGRLDQQLAQMKQARTTMGKQYEKTVRKILDTYLRTGQIDEAGYQERLARALAE